MDIIGNKKMSLLIKNIQMYPFAKFIRTFRKLGIELANN